MKLLANQTEYSVHIVAGLGTCQDYLGFIVPLQFLNFLVCYLSVRLVCFVSNNYKGYVFVGHLLNLIHPLLNTFEGFSVSKGECNKDAIRAFKVAICEGVESLLPGSVPNLELDFNGFEFDQFHFKIDCYGGQMCFLEFLLDVSLNQGAFANSTFSNDKDFGQMIILLFRHY